MMKPIALCGRLRSGKDTVADYLVDKYGYTRFAFGDGIRRVTRELYPSVYENGRKPRALLQNFGQMARQFDENVWVNDCFRRIDTANMVRAENPGYFEGLKIPVITDTRQPNEFDRCKSEGFVIIRVNCPDRLRLERAISAGDAFTESDLNHETERHVDGFTVDYDVHNTGSLDELYAQIDEIMAKIAD